MLHDPHIFNSLLQDHSFILPTPVTAAKYSVLAPGVSFALWENGLMKQYRKNRVDLFESNIKTIWWNISAMYIFRKVLSYHIPKIICRILDIIPLLEIISVGKELEL